MQVQQLLWSNIMKIEMYTQDMCGYCTAAKEEFEERGWTYVTHNIKHKENLKNLKELMPNVRTVPQIWIDDKHIGGYDELLEWLFVPTNATVLEAPNEKE